MGLYNYCPPFNINKRASLQQCTGYDKGSRRLVYHQTVKYFSDCLTENIWLKITPQNPEQSRLSKRDEKAAESLLLVMKDVMIDVVQVVSRDKHCGRQLWLNLDFVQLARVYLTNTALYEKYKGLNFRSLTAEEVYNWAVAIPVEQRIYLKGLHWTFDEFAEKEGAPLTVDTGDG